MDSFFMIGYRFKQDMILNGKNPMSSSVEKTPIQVKNKANEMFEIMKNKMLEGLSDEDREAYARFGKKFHSSFDVDTGTVKDLSTISMEESLAYVSESLKSGLHPSYLTEDEIAILRAGYGDEWYKRWSYTQKDLEKKK